ncbi:S8 family serine peptidase [Actinokineospora inagensis]|uniref:S8 family serine peptidase n=1 Tax=Actinokineospora inagensis TaxID=103730 RepID=UPI00041FF058|nr:S8 family serine peptidase [Actinokineospora inagensis]
MRFRGLVGAVVVAAALVLPSAGVGAATTAPAGDAVTLVTGDRLRVLPGPRGEFAVEVLPTPGREHVGFLRDGSRIVPADAEPLVESGRLDPRLFDLSLLPRDSATPVIVTDSGPRAGLSLSATDVRPLPSVNGAAMKVGPGFWSWLATTHASVWLDGYSQPTQDVSVAQIGAPSAWQAGYTGAGVTVGLLDTGVDGTHPDLAGKVVEQNDFTGTGTTDQIGHGTHVAGIIAGTGAASGGRYRGVAPDAKLVSGKVCARMGCPDSAVIAGMEWIAPKAKVVNISLGGAYSDGKDPVSRSLNTLTAQYGTLFVVAAGNDRALDTPDPFASVTSPAAADSAVAVGSVTKEDTTSPFSPRQPRLGDYAVKPDLAAPGSDIVSDRVVGTPSGDQAPVDEHYATLSGTSMAAPHVAGTAALMAQRRPDWTAEQLRAVLVSSAKPTADAFEQGAGRVDAARAVQQVVSAVGGGLGYGFLAWPHSTRLSKSVTYRNDGDAAVTLALSTDNPVFSAAVKQVVVPAHGTAAVAVNADPSGRTGRQSGRLTGTGGGVVVQTALTAVLEAESYNATVTVKGRTGSSASTVVKAVNTDTGAALGVRTGVTRLPKGHYDFQAIEVATTGEVSLLTRPGVTVDRDTSVTLDATRGRAVSTTVDNAKTSLVAGEFTLVSGNASGDRTSALGWFSQPGQQVYLVPVDGRVSDHTFLVAYRATLEATGSIYHLAFLDRGTMPSGQYTARQRDLAQVDARYYAQGAPSLSLRADYARLDAPGVNSGAFQAYQIPVPGNRTEYFAAGPSWEHLFGVFPADASDVETSVSYRTYQPGRYATHWNRAPLSPAFGSPELGFGIARAGDTLTVAVAPLSGGDPDQSTVLAANATGSTKLTRDGKVLGTSDLPGAGSFPLPSTPGTYTLLTSVDRTVPWSVIGTHADISWTFKEGGSGSTTPPPALTVRTTADVDSQGKAAPGSVLPIRLTVQRQAGAPTSRVTTLRTDYSTDDGKTWHPALTLHSSTGDGVAVLVNPSTAGFVSLRVNAQDADGNAVTQTVIRAYQVG